MRATTAKARPIDPFERRPECGARGVRQVTSGVTDFLWLYDFFNTQNIEHGYINVLFSYVNVMGYNRSLKKNQFYMGNIDFGRYTSMLCSIHNFLDSFMCKLM